MMYGSEHKTYEQLLKEALDDEAKAGNMYRGMADKAPSGEAANALRSIAADEDRHYRILSYLETVALMAAGERHTYTEHMEYELGHRHPGQVGVHRLFPETYGDWVDLAEDIKDMVDTSGYAEVNFRLGIIGGDVGDVDAAKRWLVQRARELGIT